MKPKVLSIIIYVVLGAIFLLGGLLTLLKPSLGIPSVFVASDIDVSLMTMLREHFMHYTQELSIAFITLGASLIWASFNSHRSEKANYAFFLFFLLFAGIHWLEFIRDNRTIVSPLVNSIPLLLIIVQIGIGRKYLYPKE